MFEGQQLTNMTKLDFMLANVLSRTNSYHLRIIAVAMPRLQGLTIRSLVSNEVHRIAIIPELVDHPRLTNLEIIQVAIYSEERWNIPLWVANLHRLLSLRIDCDTNPSRLLASDYVHLFRIGLTSLRRLDCNFAMGGRIVHDPEAGLDFVVTPGQKRVIDYSDTF